MQSDLLKDYIPRPKMAEQIGKSEKTLVRWENDGIGPPVTRLGKNPYYYRPSFEKWLRAQERAPKAA
jgi:hypothetical protein